MKLTVAPRVRSHGFALPAIILISTIMITILVAAIGAAAGSRVALDSQYYNQLANLATESGIARANECLRKSGYTPQWSTKALSRDLRPDTDCTGSTAFGTPYTLGEAGGSASSKVRTTYSIEAPSGSGIGSALKVVGTTQLVRTTPPESVWRTYEQVAYLRIEPPKVISCPEGYISVPGNPLFGTTDFCVAKYEAKNVSGKAGSQAAGVPYVKISQLDAITAAQNACEGCHLITEAEWLTIAHNVVSVGSNWTGGAVGVGELYRGHSDNNPSRALEASDDDSDGYLGTGNIGDHQRRTLRLSNGEVIWDFSGNVWEYTNAQLTGGQPGAAGYAWREWSSVTIKGYATTPTSPLWSPFPDYGTPAAAGWNFTNNSLGKIYSSSSDGALKAFLRSGSWFDSNGYGVFTLALNRVVDASHNIDAGFRIAR